MSDLRSFYGLFVPGADGATFSAVRVPRLQRDYAQGRAGRQAVGIRNRFVTALLAAIDDGGGPLHLDFVYGVTNGGVLDVIDGQQRLTTLFLLHWYLACVGGAGCELRTRLFLPNERRCRFSYEVRPSSADFFGRLTEIAPEVDAIAMVGAPSSWIEDQYWFAGLQEDPTIRGCLTMLDVIADRCKGRDAAKMYARLTDRSAPGVTFSLFPLAARELDADVYVKLNARGLELTDFDSFKVGFEALVSRQEGEGPSARTWDQWKRIVADGFDTTWGESVWRTGKARTTEDPGETHSDHMLIFLRALAYLASVMVPLEDDLLEGEESTIQALRDQLRLADPTNPARAGSLDADGLEPLLGVLLPLIEAVFDALPQAISIGDSAWFPANSLLHMVRGQPLATPGGSARATYTDHAQILGWFLFLGSHRGRMDEPCIAAELREWSRLIHHYTTHIEIRAADLDFVVHALIQMSEGVARRVERVGRVLGFAASQDFLGLFRPPRAPVVDAEWRKARLLVADDTWQGTLDTMERHVLHRGDVDFIFRFAGIEAEKAGEWSKAQHAEHRAEFERWSEASRIVFPEVDVEDTAFLLERTLLALGGTLRYSAGVSYRVPDWGTERFRWRDAVGVRAKALESNRTAIEALVRARVAASGDPSREVFLGTLLNQRCELLIVEGAADDWGPWVRLIVETDGALRYCCGEQPEGTRPGKRNLAFFWREGVRRVSLQKTTSAHGEKFDLYLYSLLGSVHAFKATNVHGNPDKGPPRATYETLGVRVEVHGSTFTISPLQPDMAGAFTPCSDLSVWEAARWLGDRQGEVGGQATSG